MSQPLSSTYGYGYNPLNWTTALTSTLNGISSTQALTHDAEGRLTGWSSGGSTQSWQYDGNGNLTLSLSNSVPTTYTYGNGVPNELSKLQTPGQYTRKYAYDQQGDTTSITTTGAYSASLRYDSQARLSSVTLADGTVISQTYTAAGQRASYSVSKNGVTSLSERFQYRGDELGQAVVISGSQTYTDTYLYDQSGNPLELLRQQTGSTSRYWYVLDGRGNVVALTDVNGNVVDRYAYDAWGVPTTSSETVPQRLRYAGYWYDAELGWYWVRVRSYDPQLKRWLQPDPSQQDGVRTFVYAYDDPSDVNDPTGLAGIAGGNDPCIIARGDPSWIYYQWRCWQKHGHVHWVSPYYLPVAAGAWLLPKAPRVFNIDVNQPELRAAIDKMYTSGTTRGVGSYGEYVQDLFWEQFGYERIGGHPWTNSLLKGIDGVYKKITTTMENAKWPRFIVSDAKPQGSHPSPTLKTDRAALQEAAVSSEDIAAMEEEGFIVVRTEVSEAGPMPQYDGTDVDDGSYDIPYSRYTAAQVGVIQDALVEGASGALPFTGEEELPPGAEE